jgi:hypothetical protein
VKGSRFLTVLAAVLIIGSVVAGWIAIGRLSAATERGLARTEESLTSAKELATSTAASAVEVRRVIGIVGEGLASTGDAMSATRQVSANVRSLLDIASFLDRVDALNASLVDAETSIANVEADLAEAAGSVEEAGPVLGQTVQSLQAIPGQIERSVAQVKASRARIGQQVWLWRSAIVAGGAALLVLLVLVARLGRVVAGRLAVQP